MLGNWSRRLQVSKIFTVLVVFLCFASSEVFAQRQNPTEVYKILGISVEGNRTADAAAIIGNSGLKIGDEITLSNDAAAAQAIKRLWSLKIFSDIQIVVENKVADGVYLLIKVREYPRLDKIEITGNSEIKEDKIKEKISIVRGQTVTSQEISKIIRAVTKLYEENGYLLARVKADTVYSDLAANRVTLKLDITEGPEVQVEKIMFSGNKAFDEGDLKSEMKETSEKKWWKFWSSAKFDRKKYAEDKKLILDFYRKKGYRDADILSDSIWYDESKERMFIKINLYEGMQYHIRNIKWIGNTVYSDTVLSELLGFAKGDVYDMDKFEKNLKGNEQQTDVAALYQNSGYLTFQLMPEEIRLPPDSIDIIIRISEKNQFKIGLVNIKGNTKTKEKVIRRELYTLPGEYFSRAAIIRSIRQLANLGYFVPEKIKPDYSLANDSTVNLTYEVEERSSDTFNASVGYSGTFGFSGAIGLTFNNFSITEPLSGGGGQQLNFEWQFGQYNYQTFSIGFNEPWFLDTPTLLGFSVADSRIGYYGLDQRTTGGSARIGRRFRWPDDYFRGDWTLSFQRIEVNKDETGRFQLGTYLQTTLLQVISRNSIDNPLFPSMGSNISLATELAGGFLPGQSDYYKINFNAEWYTPLFRIGQSNRLALYTGAQFGVLGEIKTGTYIYPYDFFRMGGGGLVYATIPLRGYEDGSVGPRDDKGLIIGGKVMLKSTTELRFQVSPDPIPIYVLAFAEAGNVWKDWQHTDIFNLKRSAGVGVRLLIQPVGLIGFDYGYGFDPVPPYTTPSGWKFHFQFGRGF